MVTIATAFADDSRRTYLQDVQVLLTNQSLEDLVCISYRHKNLCNVQLLRELVVGLGYPVLPLEAFAACHVLETTEEKGKERVHDRLEVVKFQFFEVLSYKIVLPSIPRSIVCAVVVLLLEFLLVQSLASIADV